MKNKKVLILAYYWPPLGGAGVQRWLKMTKFMAEFGWEPIVLTVREGTSAAYDESLHEEVHPNVKVIRTKTIEPFGLYNRLKGKKGKQVDHGMSGAKNPSNWYESVTHFIRANLFVPDARLGWYFYALPAARKIITEESISCFITTGPPHSIHRVGLKVKKDHPNLRWLVDLRDPWTSIYYNQFLPKTKAVIRYEKKLETEVLEKADLVTVVSEGMKDEFSDRNEEVHVVYNGYDEEDFIAATKGYRKGEKLTLTYMGNFKAGHHHEPFWDALVQLMGSHSDFSSLFQFQFVGNVNTYTKEKVASYGLESIIRYRGYQPHREAVQLICSSDLLFFITSDTKGNERLVTGKLFEYLASQRPIFAIGNTKGIVNEILQECGHGPMMPFHDTERYIKRLLTILQEWKRHGLSPIQSDEYQQYQRKAQTKKILSLISNHSPS